MNLLFAPSRLPCAAWAGRRLALLAVALLCLLASGCRVGSESALDAAKREARRKPCVATYLSLGQAYSRAQMHNDAYVALCAAERLDPNSFDAAYQLALCLSALGAPGDCLTWAGRAISLRPTSSSAHQLAGTALMQAGRLDAAIKELRRAADLDGDDLAVRLNLASAYAAKGDVANALSCSRAATALKPKDSNAHFALADLLERQGNLAEAEREFDRAGNLDANAREAKLRLAMLYIRQKREYDEARHLAHEADAIDPGDGTPAALAAWALYSSGSRLDAAMELQTVVQGHPYNQYAWARFADALKGLGKDKQAVQAARRAAMLAPYSAK